MAELNNASMKYFIFILLIPLLGFSQWTRTELKTQKVKKVQEKLKFSGLYSLDRFGNFLIWLLNFRRNILI